MATLEFEGLDEMAQSLLRNASPEKRLKVLRKYGAKVKEAAINKAQFTKGYSTGATRRSITLQTGGNQAVIEALTNYSG